MSDRDRFYSVISQFSFLKPFWDQKNHEFKSDLFEERLGTMSAGEAHLAKFMAAVWLHNNKYHFDLFSAVGSVSGSVESVIQDWVKCPYCP